ncbi:MAG: hypothetical protein WC441_02200 [Patescibacteria group bacterium]
MKKTLILFLFCLVGTTVFAQRFQALVGNGYGERKGHGDLTFRFGEGRWLPFIEEGRECKFGFFFNATQVSSGFDDYVYQAEELTPGLSLEYCPTSAAYLTEIYSWFNLGYKFSSDQGGINTGNGVYTSKQKDEMIYFFSGLVFTDKLARPFYIKKFTLTYQNPVKTEGLATWKANEITGGLWNKEYFSLSGESSIFSIILNPSGSLKLDPTIFLSYSHESGNSKDYYSWGVKGIFRRDFSNQELLTLSGGFRTTVHSIPMLELQAILNLAETVRYIKH